jgi:transcriptional regulator with XRE-family HTH domain
LVYFKNIGIRNVLDLQKLLKKKEKLAELTKVDGFSEDFLVVLLREINSIQPKPNKLNEFFGISSETVSKLEKNGIKDTLKLFDHVLTLQSRKKLAAETNIPEAEILELTKLTDLSRIKWVGATFARMLYEVGVDTAEKASKTDYVDFSTKRFIQLNKEKNFYKGQIGLHDDIKLFVDAAREFRLKSK